jgi:lambda repressor-like predicted transcriptional regulator
MKDLARENGVSPSAFYNCFYFPFPKGERIISAILNCSAQEIWPERYSECRRIRRRRKGNTVKRVDQEEKNEERL